MTRREQSGPTVSEIDDFLAESSAAPSCKKKREEDVRNRVSYFSHCIHSALANSEGVKRIFGFSFIESLLAGEVLHLLLLLQTKEGESIDLKEYEDGGECLEDEFRIKRKRFEGISVLSFQCVFLMS
ncbi:hypothetical protein CEXT_162131 [Caerostris extrusa]|uniref:Uncharacterized protein n=1 Tax=Caerostris extrusa TaxID=172846 RepID=A0AAV4NLL2_CAEEX|nr:hypothetical protein CEXT_162131 [Caerostris extrusa]